MRTTRCSLLSPRAVAATAAVLLAGAGVTFAPTADALQVTPIGPHQVFVGETDGPMGVDTILLVCAGPGSMGHPAAGQTVEVLPASTTSKSSGFTGSKANRIVVEFPTTTTTPLIALQAYDVPVPIPTSLSLPCGGTEPVGFIPVPTSKSARTDLVRVALDPGPAAN